MDYKHAVFIRIPKTGSTTVTKTLMTLGFNSMLINKNMDRLYEHFTQEGFWCSGHHDLLKMYREGYINEHFWQNSFKFTIVRNPYTRIVSLFHYLQGTKHNCGSFKEFTKKLEQGIEPIGLYNRQGLSQCNPQYHWVFGDMDFVGKMENLDNDFQKICNFLNINYNDKLPRHRNRGIKNYDKYFDKETRSKINQIYEQDFIKFNYNMIYE